MHGWKKEAGCKVWYIDAEELEGRIKELIVEHRSSTAFEDEVRELVLQGLASRQGADEAVETARREVAQRESALQRIVAMAAKAVSESEDESGDDVFAEEVRTAKRALAACNARLEQAKLAA